MKKYYIGIIAIGVVTLGLVIYTISLGSAAKQDQKTEKKVNEIAQKLNSYISTNQKIPATLQDAKINDVPDTVKYTKKSEAEYEFCVTYKSASDYGPDVTSIFWGGAIKQAQEDQYDNYYNNNSYKPSTLYPSYYHKKGENCQTIKPYLNNNICYDTPASGASYSCVTPQYNSSSSSSSASSVADTERKTDIQAVKSHLEVYNAKYDLYPTLANLNDATWISANLKGLDTAATCDPKSTAAAPCDFASVSTTAQYGYIATQDDNTACDNSSGKECTKFILTYTDSTGKRTSILSLN